MVMRTAFVMLSCIFWSLMGVMTLLFVPVFVVIARESLRFSRVPETTWRERGLSLEPCSVPLVSLRGSCHVPR